MNEPASLLQYHDKSSVSQQMSLESQIADLQTTLAIRDREIAALLHENQLLRAGRSVDSTPRETGDPIIVKQEPLPDRLDTFSSASIGSIDLTLDSAAARPSRAAYTPTSKRELEDDEVVQARPTRRLKQCFVEVPARRKHTAVRPTSDGEERYVVVLCEEAQEFWKSLCHPDIKVKVKEDLSLEHVAYNRLQTFGFTQKLELELSREMRTFTVRRKWMSVNLGGSLQPLVGRPCQAKRALHGYDHFLYLSPRFHPDAPKSQGAPGVFYGVIDFDNAFPNNARTFVNIGQDGNYYYVGDYEIRRAAPLTPHEWMSLPMRIRKSWCDMISTADWCRALRIRMTLRRRCPEGEGLLMVDIEEAEASTDKFRDISSDDVQKAFGSGEEQVYVWCMNPVRYDEDLVNKLMRWVEETKKGRRIRF